MTAAVRPLSLDAALAVVAGGAARRDRAPVFPADALGALTAAGATVPPPSIAAEWALVRRVAAADGSVARILDGHLNAVERVRVAAPPELRDELERAVAEDGALLGLWGADPAPDEAAAARLRGTGPERRLDGAKTFCSGAGGLAGALVVAGADDGRRLVHVDLRRPGIAIDRAWFRAMGMRASESHLVRFDDVPATVLGRPGELGREPWFGRDALRTTHTWAGLADAVAEAADALLGPRARTGDDLAALALGRIATQRGTVDRWLNDAAARADADPSASLLVLSVHARDAVAGAARALVDEAERGVGSRPLVTGSPLDRAARDLRVFLLQHRLDPLVAKAGRDAAGVSVAGRPRLQAAYFDALYAGDPDPWDFATSAYERAKYDATMAALAGRRFARGLEIGCSIGVLTERLATVCEELVAVDGAQAAVEAARSRLAGRPGVSVIRASLPEQWPAGSFDLVVASEVLYYFDRDTLCGDLLPGLVDRLRPGGVLLAVHWRPETTTYPLRGDEVHALLARTAGLRPAGGSTHARYRLDVLEREP